MLEPADLAPLMLPFWGAVGNCAPLRPAQARHCPPQCGATQSCEWSASGSENRNRGSAKGTGEL